MGNTPSHPHGSPSRPSSASQQSQHAASNAAPGPGPTNPSSSSPSPASTPASNRHPNLRLPMPSRPSQFSQDSNPTSPSGNARNASGSPRRRKSLELPDLNKLSFTPAAPVATTATTTNHHHHLATPNSGSKGPSPSGNVPAPAGRKWQHVLGGRASPLAGANSLGAMSKVASVSGSGSGAQGTGKGAMESVGSPSKGATPDNPYFPASPSGRRAGAPPLVVAIPATPPPKEPEPKKAALPDDGLVDVPVQWTGGGKAVYVTGNFADNWRSRIKLKKSTHDFNTMLRLPPGQYRMKFIVDDSWRCSKQIPTATDDDGTLVNYIEVEPAKTEEEIQAEWAMDAKPVLKEEDDEGQWTSVIPAPLVAYQYIEEIPLNLDEPTFTAFVHSVPHISSVPQPPTLPRILDKVIVNAEPRRRSFDESSSGAGHVTAGLDDNSILAVPNHVVLNHLTASAIKNGTLGVGTTTRYRKKYITTMFFKPTLGDLMGDTAPAPEPASQ